MRAAGLEVLRRVLAGVGEYGATCHSDCVKLVSKSTNVRVARMPPFFPQHMYALLTESTLSPPLGSPQDKEASVRLAGALLLPQVVAHSKGFTSVKVPSVVQVAIKVGDPPRGVCMG